MVSLVLAEAHPAIEEQGVEGDRIGLGHPARGGVGQLVRFADHEVVEGEARIERRADVAAGTVGTVLVLTGPPGAPVLRIQLAGRSGPAGTGLRIRAVRFRRRSPGNLDHDVDAPDPLVLVDPQQLDPVGVVALHPIAHEARRNSQAHGAVDDTDQGQGLQPASEGGFADLAAQTAAHACPVLLGDGIDFPAGHGLTPRRQFESRRSPPGPVA
jgi:hypothetical protein